MNSYEVASDICPVIRGREGQGLGLGRRRSIGVQEHFDQ
jgi:hypothetical protein